MTDPPPMAGRVVLITGGTSGVGKATAIGLATLGAPVGIRGRVLARAEQAVVDIRAASGNPNVDAFEADMTSQAEVRRLAAEVLDAYSRLDVLVKPGSSCTRRGRGGRSGSKRPERLMRLIGYGGI
jgi:retinol dehydrogenase-14